MFDAEGGTTEIAHRGESAHERVTGADHGLGEHVADLARTGDLGRDSGEHGVPVGIDEARDQGLSGAVDLAAGVAQPGGADEGDRAIADSHVKRAVDPARDAIEDVDVRNAKRLALAHSCIPLYLQPRHRTSCTAMDDHDATRRGQSLAPRHTFDAKRIAGSSLTRVSVPTIKE